MRKICVFTGTRAEYGILSDLMKLIDNDESLKLQIVATNMHLSPEFGLTYREIENDGFVIDKKVEMLLSSDTQIGTVKSMGLGAIGFADALNDLSPDLIVILGDRFEMLVAAQSALIFKVPIAHLYGGEITEGAYDDSIRHAITKMSHLHFTSTEEYRHRVIQMGEAPERVFHVGALGIDNILRERIMSLKELEESLSFSLGDKFLVVTFHPVTMESCTAEEQCKALLNVLEKEISQYKILFTLPNSDTNGRIIISLIRSFVNTYSDRSIAVTSLGKHRYYAALKYATAVIGNSSSGLVEVPAFHIPTLNIGDRQKGRCRGDSVVDCAATNIGINKGMSIVLSEAVRNKAKYSESPYYKQGVLHSIFDVISTYPLGNLLNKTFYNL